MEDRINLDSYHIRKSPGASATEIEAGWWRLAIPGGPAGRYRWAQLDDYSGLPRRRFLWQVPLNLECSVRVSQESLPGTWGFGFWNDPFSAGLIRGAGLNLPCLPNTAWFFHASPENHLSLQFQKPASGFMAAIFRSPLVSSGAFLPVIPFAPLLLIPACARLAVRILRRWVSDRFESLDVKQTEWNTYRIEIQAGRTDFLINGRTIFTTPFAPQGRLGALVWIDNQYAAISPGGRLRSGLLENKTPAWLEVKDWLVTPLD